MPCVYIVLEIHTLDPLESEEGVKSDHRILYTTSDLNADDAIDREKRNSKRRIITRKINAKTREKFTNLLLSTDWLQIEKADPSESAASLAYLLDSYISECFPTRTITIRNKDPPWITPYIRRKIRRRKLRFKKYGRDEVWRRMKRETDR